MRGYILSDTQRLYETALKHEEVFFFIFFLILKIIFKFIFQSQEKN